jgi:CHAT domain-containing protein/tetratricopeptide (TPR) repeat protein
MRPGAVVLALGLLGAADCGRQPPSQAPSGSPGAPFRHAVSCPAAPRVPNRWHQLASPAAMRSQLAAGEAEGFELRLVAGDYLRLLADQSAIDLVLCFYGPDRTLLLALDSPNGRDEPEELLWSARQAGIYTLIVDSADNPATPRPYSLALTGSRHPSERDRERLAAVLAAAEGEELRRSASPAAWPLAGARYRQSLEDWRRLGDRFRQADLEVRLARLHRDRLEDLRQALLGYERARVLFTQLGQRRRAALVVAALGKTSMALARLDAAIVYQRQALADFSTLGDRREQAVAFNEIGYLSELRGDWQTALDSYSRALPLWSATGDHAGRGTTLHNRGLLYASLGEYREALDDLTQARQLRAGTPRAEAATLSAMGNAWSQAGRPAAGLPLLQQALALRAAAGDRRGEAVTQSGLGIVLRKLGRLAEAATWHRRALAIFAKLGDQDDRARALHNLGATLEQAGQAHEAVAVLAAAVDGGRRCGDEELMAASLLDQARSERDLGDRLAALPLARQALKSIETQRVRSPSQRLRSTFFAAKQDFYDFAVELLMDLDQQFPGHGYRVEALDVSERGRARSLLDQLQESGIELRQGLPPDLVAARGRLEAAIRLDDELLARSQTDEGRPAAAEPLARRMRGLLREYDRITARIHAVAPGYHSLTQAEPLSTEQIQHQVLDSETLLLHYRLGDQRSFLWLVTPATIDVFPLPARDFLDRLARRAHRLLSAPDPMLSRPQAELTLRRLSDALLAPAAERLGRKRLLVVADGALQTVPFAALPGPGQESGRHPIPLIVDHEVVTMPSASALAILKSQQEHRRPAPRLLAVIADPVFAASDPRVPVHPPRSTTSPLPPPDQVPYQRLRYSRLEARAIAAVAPAGDLFTALDFSANRRLVLSGALSQYRIVHFATHAAIDPDHPELSRLVLSLVDEQGRPQDGLLYAHEILDLHLPAELIVLSGCETGLGKEIRGEGLVGLPQAFLYAGAARLVVSLWQVDDRATSRLVGSFYRHLLQGHEPAAQALRDAQIERWREEPWRYDWAAFVSLGRWR